MNELEIIKNKIKDICDNYEGDKIGGWITGDGPVPCDLLFIGEAPGKTEVEEGKPFVGMAGKNFQHYLSLIKLDRKDVRITNTCYFRPIKVKQNQNGRTSISNRPPKTSEIALFKDILEEEINLVNPKLIITLGNVPLKNITNFKSIGECHGTLTYNESFKKNIFPMYHPSALTYNRNDEFKKMYEADWYKLKQALDEI